jgi:hypothetical protein|tara:strand:- start:1078 stop:1239 length:162 start_codon:yes stop_codon:yes gene_type:complete
MTTKLDSNELRLILSVLDSCSYPIEPTREPATTTHALAVRVTRKIKKILKELK